MNFWTLCRAGGYAVELRDVSWHTSEIFAILRRHRVAFCIFEIGGYCSPLEITGHFAYVRLHGPAAPYQDSYSGAALQRWARRIRAWQKELRAIYLYFDNDNAGHAIENGLDLKRLLGVRLRVTIPTCVCQALDVAVFQGDAIRLTPP